MTTQGINNRDVGRQTMSSRYLDNCSSESMQLEASFLVGNARWIFAAWLWLRPALKMLLLLLLVVGVFTATARSSHRMRRTSSCLATGTLTSLFFLSPLWLEEQSSRGPGRGVLVDD